MRSRNRHRDHRSGVFVFFVALGVLVAACGDSSSESTTEADPTDPSPETLASAEQSEPEAQSWVGEVAAVVETMWEAERAVERLNDVYGGPSAVDTVRQRLSVISEVVATANEALPVDAPTEFEGPFDTLADAVDEWLDTVGTATDSLDASGQDLQAEIDEMGDDIGQINFALRRAAATVLDVDIDMLLTN